MVMVYSRRLLTVSSLLFLCILSGPSWRATAITNQNDVNALNGLYDRWSSSGSLDDWTGNDPCGSFWTGVTCDSSATNVIELDLKRSNITGGIPPAIGDLSSLESLDLSYNEILGGTLPQELGKLANLEFLILMNAGLTGPIPAQLGQLTKLEYLAINRNSLTGQIPAALGNLGLMYWFDISENLLSGPLPVSTARANGVDSLTSAEHFHFNNNSLSGNIPAEIFNLPKLKHLLLYSNAFEGTIPTTTLSNARVMTLLRLDNNFLTGTLPPGLNTMLSLNELTLANNSFTGTLPDLSAAVNITLLDVSFNAFDEQEFPAWAYQMQSAVTINMDYANLTGPLNSTIFSLSSLQGLSLSNNSLNGSVSLGSPSTTLRTVNLQYNRFHVYDASPNGNTSYLSLWLAGNPFCTTFSGSPVCQVSSQGPQTWVGGPNPSCHASCDGGKVLNPKLCSCASPLVCHMQLTSPAFSRVNDTTIESLSSEWAQFFTTSTTLSVHLDPKQVYIGDANFTDDGRMLHDMSFFPYVGDSLNTTEVFNILKALTSQVFHLKEGPYLLLGFTPPPTVSTKKKSKTSIGLIIGVAVAGIAAFLIIALIAFYAIRQKKRADKAEVSRPFASWGASTKDSGDAPQLKGARWFSLAELRKATDNFSEDKEIGRGGYGKVYRAELPGGIVAAVKRADEGSVQGAVEFKNEIELLSRVHHRNLVGLVGFCYEHGEQALVYEFLPNGTLREHLLGHHDVPLTWDARVAIALGSARGLTYLHELANPPIIHRDIKSGNILLDEKMVPKVADFGLSKLAPDGPNNGHVSTQVKGTLGYLDPEYYMTNQLSEKSDVYSFGVVMLEMLSARPPIERGRYIVREVRNALNKGGIKALGPLLDPFLGDYPPKQLEAFLDLALLCVEEVAAGRPTMSEVVKKLEVIVGHSQPNSGVHITIEPQKSDDLYGKDKLENNNDPSFHYSGVSLTAHANVEPK